MAGCVPQRSKTFSAYYTLKTNGVCIVIHLLQTLHRDSWGTVGEHLYGVCISFPKSNFCPTLFLSIFCQVFECFGSYCRNPWSLTADYCYKTGRHYVSNTVYLMPFSLKDNKSSYINILLSLMHPVIQTILLFSCLVLSPRCLSASVLQRRFMEGDYSGRLVSLSL